MVTWIKFSPRFALQIDELTDVVGLPQPLVFFRYCFEGNINEDTILRRLLTGLQEVTYIRGYKWVYHFRIYMLAGLCLRRQSGHKKGFLAEVRQASCWSHKLYALRHSHRAFGITWPSAISTYHATRGRRSREPCEISPFELSPVFSIARESAGRLKITSVAFVG
jgi:hypothetical protein